MAENSKFLRTLQLISGATRKINPKNHILPASPVILESLPEHKPLLPLLLSHDIPSNLASVCADRYDSYANQLRSETETKLTPYLINRVGSQPAAIYSLFLDNYSHTLRRWAQSILSKALKRLSREPVELHNWDVIHPSPLWLPSLELYPAFACRNIQQRSCPLSSAPTPPHAFPTTYPPPLRPSSELPPIIWPRTPAASPSSPPASTFDLDSLCLRFTKHLVIDENRTQPPQPKTSMFSLPNALTKGKRDSRSCTKLSRGRPTKPQHSHGLQNLEPTLATPRSAAKHRQLSVPPSFPPPLPKTRLTPRKANAPARVLTSKHARVSSRSSDPTYHSTPTTSSPTLTTTDGLDMCSYPYPSISPLEPQSPDPGQITHTPQGLSYSFTGPTTPPAVSPDLFSEPVIVPSTHVHLPPGSSLMPIADPFTQYQLRSDNLFNPSVIPSFDCSGSTTGFAADDFFSKSTFDTPFGSDHPPNGTATHLTHDPYENNYFNTFAVF